MDNNSFSFMKQGFDWQETQSKDMVEIDDRHDSDEEELKHERDIMKADDLRDEWRESGMSIGDFFDDRGW
jgi:cysteinyl-tRNA synthetase